jgi:NADH-quinone oxidoreductase subunit J
MIETILFYLFSFLAVGGGLVMITRRNVIVSGVWLIVSLLGVAGLFLLEGAEFLFVAQLILYIGGVVLLFLIAVMLIDPSDSAIVRRFRPGWPIIGAVGAGLAAELVILISRASFPAAVIAKAGPPQNTEAVADTLFSQYLTAFELASIVLLAALVGAVIMGQRRDQPSQGAESQANNGAKI